MISLNALAAQEHRADLIEAAAHWNTINEGAVDAGSTADVTVVAVRAADPGEHAVVHRLAQLDDARDLEGSVLLALVDGEAVAGLSLADGRVVADPFRRTADAVAVLELKAAQLSSAPRRRRVRSLLRPRFA